MTPGQWAFKLSYELSPIILTGGVAQLIPGGMLPVIAITQGLDFVTGILSGGDVDPNDFFATFQPLTGSSLIRQQIAKYPMANQSVAANSVIADPLGVSLMMIVPARGDGGYPLKLATMTALQATLATHNNSGGTYTVATPSFIYTNCLLASLTDISTGATHQRQNTYQWDFEMPLLTLAAAQAAQNSLMGKITAGLPVDGQPAWSGLGPTVNNPPSLAAPSVLPSASSTSGSGVAGAL